MFLAYQIIKDNKRNIIINLVLIRKKRKGKILNIFPSLGPHLPLGNIYI